MLALLSSAILLLATGCHSLRSGGRGAVGQLHLLGTPVALELDRKPGADGIGVRLYATQRDATDVLRITTGVIELHLFDGALRPPEIATAPPLRVWSYSAEDLKKHEHQTAVGLSYNFVPTWDKPPMARHVTVVARYVAPDGKAVYSAPFSVPLPNR